MVELQIPCSLFLYTFKSRSCGLHSVTLRVWDDKSTCSEVTILISAFLSMWPKTTWVWGHFFIKSYFSLNSIQCFLFTPVIKSPRAEVLSSMLPSSHICPVQPDLWRAWTGPQYLNLLRVGQETGKQFFPSISSVRVERRPDLQARVSHGDCHSTLWAPVPCSEKWGY